MRTETDNNTLTLYLEGRIDSNNANDVEKEIFNEVSAVLDKKIIIDAEKLEYISSAGLRVLMKLKKQIKDELIILNVSQEIYEIFETTGFTELFKVSKKLRTISVEGCEKIGEGGNGAVYRLDEDTIVKVYKPWMEQTAIERERKFARAAFVNGIPSVIAYDIVRVGDCFGIVFEMLHSDTLGHAIANNPEKIEYYVDQYVELAKTLHNTHVDNNTFTSIQEVWHGYAENLKQWYSSENIAFLHNIIDCIPERDTVMHNDLHPGNIMLQNDELVIIDMPEVTVGPALLDLAAIYRDIVSAPKKRSQVLIQSVGMPAELIEKTGNMFFTKYTGITNPSELEAYYKKLGLLYALNVSLIAGAGSEAAMKNAEIIRDNLFKPIVVPNEKAIIALLQSE